jgi:hypothetical protein
MEDAIGERVYRNGNKSPGDCFSVGQGSAKTRDEGRKESGEQDAGERVARTITQRRTRKSTGGGKLSMFGNKEAVHGNFSQGGQIEVAG